MGVSPFVKGWVCICLLTPIHPLHSFYTRTLTPPLALTGVHNLYNRKDYADNCRSAMMRPCKMEELVVNPQRASETYTESPVPFHADRTEAASTVYCRSTRQVLHSGEAKLMTASLRNGQTCPVSQTHSPMGYAVCCWPTPVHMREYAPNHRLHDNAQFHWHDAF